MGARGRFTGRARTHPLVRGGVPEGLPQVYRGRGQKTLRDIYECDHGATPPGGRFRWLMSTLLAAMVGSVAIFTVIYGSVDGKDSPDTLLPALRRLGSGDFAGSEMPNVRRIAGLNWYAPKSDRLEAMARAASTRFVIHEKINQRRNGRDYIHAKPYVRVLSRLAAPSGSASSDIPPFNPMKLYTNDAPISEGDGDGESGGDIDSATRRANVVIRVVELLGGILPVEDAQHLETSEVSEIVMRYEAAALAPVAEAPASLQADERQSENDALKAAPNTSILSKTVSGNSDATADYEDGELSVFEVAKGETLSQVLLKAGADRWQAKAMIEAARGVFPEKNLEPGNEVHVTLVASLADPNRKEPARFSVFSDGHEHKVTVVRGPAGEFEATATPVGAEAAVRALLTDDGDALQNATLYSSIYFALQQQKIESDTIVQILKVHAYETDYRRRLRVGDQVELFFDVKDEHANSDQLGELLFTAITAGGETSRFYRYRTPDGIVDYYDGQGSNSKKFIMRRPVRGNDVRLTSGFGFRFHPLLNDRKMHTGVDWAAPTGTPILAAGNGVIEQAGRKGQYGNYVRIRHANGYQTAYGHMSRIAAGAREGAKVRQGQIIGFVGSTGLSSGPHLHFEVLVNSRFVNPMSIQVPRERQLEGKQLADFQKERARIDELMRRSPVLTASKQQADAR